MDASFVVRSGPDCAFTIYRDLSLCSHMLIVFVASCHNVPYCLARALALSLRVLAFMSSCMLIHFSGVTP